jgi:hypothetical protein
MENGMGGHMVPVGVKRNAYRVSVVRHDVRSPLGGLKPRWEDNIEMNLKETGWEGVD